MKNVTTTTTMTGKNFEGLEAIAIGCKDPMPLAPPALPLPRDAARFSNILSVGYTSGVPRVMSTIQVMVARVQADLVSFTVETCDAWLMPPLPLCAPRM